MTQKLHIKTWGCQMNEYDSSKMADLLLNTHGLELTDIPEEADVLLLNTCSIREKAQEKVFHQLGRWKELKKQNPNLVIGVGGCVASQEGEHIRHRAPYVDTVGRYEGAIKEYIRNQLQEDIAQDTLNFKEYTAPFTGEPVK